MTNTGLQQARADRERQEQVKQHIRRLIKRLPARKGRYAMCSMIALFGVAFTTLDKVPQSVVRVLKSKAEVAMRSDEFL